MEGEGKRYKSESLEELVAGIQHTNAELIKSNKKEDEIQKEKDNRKILERHQYLYKELQHCKDVESYNKLWKEFAELDMKVARIKNKDLALKSRCEIENQYMVVK